MDLYLYESLQRSRAPRQAPTPVPVAAVKRLVSAAGVAALATLAAALPAAAQEDSTALDGQQSTTEETAAQDADANDGATGEDEPTEPPAIDGSATGEDPGGEESATQDGDLSAADFGKRTLKEGSRGRQVRRLQRMLTRLSFKTRVDGVFGRKTRQNVRRFELWRHLRTDGDVGLQQWRRMKRLVDRGVSYRNHRFPVEGPHDYGGAGSRFGADRGDHRHMGQDVAAAAGTKLVAAHEGRVAYTQYQGGGAGYYVVIFGRDGSDSVYMHMNGPATVRAGQKVMAGQKIGEVGNTGASYGAHLHFELWTPHWYAGGHAYDPLPSLKKWDRR